MIKLPSDLVSGEGPFLGCRLLTSLASSQGRSGKDLSGPSTLRTWITFMRALPSQPNHVPEGPPPKTIMLKVSIPTYEFWGGHKHLGHCTHFFFPFLYPVLKSSGPGYWAWGRCHARKISLPQLLVELKVSEGMAKAYQFWLSYLSDSPPWGSGCSKIIKLDSFLARGWKEEPWRIRNY